MKNTFTLRLTCLLVFTASFGFIYAATEYFFFVQFADKTNTPYRLDDPSEFLSERALQRRQYFQIECDSTDLPVNPLYIEQVKINGFKIYNTTKWFNGVTVSTTDSASISLIKTLPFIQKTEYTGKRNNSVKKVQKTATMLNNKYLTNDGVYGYAGEQIEQIKGKYLHNLSYKGQDIHIAVLDAGFLNVNTTSAYNLLFLQNRLLGTKDFVNDGSPDIYQEHYHGSSVLSTMASYLPDNYIGTAPDASYWLIRTEDASSEYPVEMDFWISGVEFADSAGVDIVNSSLGYTVFNDTTLNLTHEDLNGERTRISQAAGLAYERGIIIVNAAGNEGVKKWRKIGVPADAKNILTVGGVDVNGESSPFSSYGPSYDGRIKPEIAARASNTAIIINNGLSSSNGTSFASPIIAGMMACFLQAAKDSKKNIELNELLQLVFESASTYNNPNERIGYGIPNFERATRKLLNIAEQKIFLSEHINIYTDTMSKILYIYISHQYNNLETYVQLYSVSGELILQREFSGSYYEISTVSLPFGIYAVRLVMSNGESVNSKILIN